MIKSCIEKRTSRTYLIIIDVLYELVCRLLQMSGPHKQSLRSARCMIVKLQLLLLGY